MNKKLSGAILGIFVFLLLFLFINHVLGSGFGITNQRVSLDTSSSFTNQQESLGVNPNQEFRFETTARNTSGGPISNIIYYTNFPLGVTYNTTTTAARQIDGAGTYVMNTSEFNPPTTPNYVNNTSILNEGQYYLMRRLLLKFPTNWGTYENTLSTYFTASSGTLTSNTQNTTIWVNVRPHIVDYYFEKSNGELTTQLQTGNSESINLVLKVKDYNGCSNISSGTVQSNLSQLGYSLTETLTYDSCLSDGFTAIFKKAGITTNLGTGDYTFDNAKFSATDSNGNQNTINDPNTTFDNEDKKTSTTLTIVPSLTPVLSFINLSEDTIGGPEKTTTILQISSTSSGSIKAVVGGNSTCSTGTIIENWSNYTANNTKSITINSSQLSQGANNIRVCLGSNSYTGSLVKEITKDITPPTVSIPSYTVNVTGNDSKSSFNCSEDGYFAGEVGGNGNYGSGRGILSWSGTTVGKTNNYIISNSYLNNGSNTFYVYCKDKASNVSYNTGVINKVSLPPVMGNITSFSFEDKTNNGLNGSDLSISWDNTSGSGFSDFYSYAIYLLPSNVSFSTLTKSSYIKLLENKSLTSWTGSSSITMDSMGNTFSSGTSYKVCMSIMGASLEMGGESCRTIVMDGVCGSNAKSYSGSVTGYTGSFCSNGNVSPTNPSFPGEGGNVTWTCNGIGGGNDVSCSAYKEGLSSEEEYIVYKNVSDGWKLYRKNANDTNNGLPINNVVSEYPTISPDGQYIVYKNVSDGNKLYRKNANDISNGSAITSVNSYFPTYSPDGQYIIYTNASDGFRLYRKNANDISNGSAITSVLSYYITYSPDGQHIVYTNASDGFRLYRKNANDISNGSAIVSVSSYSPTYSPDGQYIVYINNNDRDKLYRKNANDISDGSAITSVYSDYPKYSPDGQYIVYTNFSDGAKLYRKNASDNLDGSAITSNSSYNPIYSPLTNTSNGQCGTNSKLYLNNENSYSGSFCSNGTPSNANISFPLQGQTINWSCIGTNSGTIANCSATKDSYCPSGKDSNGNCLNLTYNNNLVYNNSNATCNPYEYNALNYLSNLNNKQSTQVYEADKINWADPVNPATGEFDYNNTLISIPGKKLPYEFKISYKNQTYYNGPMGINWDHNYNMYLVEEENQNILFYNGKLGVFRFLKSSTGSTYEYNLGLKANLVKDGPTFQINFDSGDKYYFNTQNKLQKLQDKYENELTFTYNSGTLFKVYDTLGREINYSYEGGKLKEVTDFNGNKVILSYYDGTSTTDSGSLNDLKGIKILNNGKEKVVNFEYSTGSDNSNAHNITKLYDSKGQTYVTNTYENDRVKTQEYGTGTVTYNYTLSGSQVIQNTVTDKVGNITDYIYDEKLNNTETRYHVGTGTVNYVYTYDENGYMLTQKSPKGNGTRYTYDSRGNIMEKREKADTSLLNNNDEDLITTYRYTDRNQVKQINYPNGTITTNTYDEAGNLIETTTSVIKDSDLNTYSITKTFEYNSHGELIKSIDGNGNEINYTYSGGLLTQTTSGTGGNTRTSTISYNSYGIPTSITDAKGNTTNYEITEFNQVGTGITSEGIVKRFTYDENNNKTKEELVIGAGEIKETNYIYNILDELIGVNEEYDQSKNITTNIKYDNNGNIIEKTTGSGAKVKYTYNNFAKVTQENVIVNPSDNSKDLTTNYEYDNNGNIIKKTDPRGKITSYEYDRYDRLTKEIKADNTYTTLIYNKDSTISQALQYSQTNTLLSKTQYFQNGIGKMVKEITYKDPINNSGAVTIKTDYDKNGNIIKKTDPKGNITTFSYDEFNNLVQTQDSLGNKIINTYDKNNNIVSKKVKQSNNKETTTTYTYDDDNRVISETNELNKTKTYTYNKLNQITSVTDEEGNITNYTYDYAGKVKSETKVLSSGNIVTSYTYDERGNMLSVTDGKGNTTNYEYDNLNRLVKQTYPDSSFVSYTYDKNSNIKTKTDPNGTTVTNTYDDLDRLITKSITTGSGVAGVTSENYNYDSLGRLISATDSNNHNLSFTYDSLNRLLQENQSGSIVSYSYDNNNNLVSITNPSNNVINYTYDDINRVTSIKKNSDSIADYTYTGFENTSIALGNSTSITKTYDELSRLSSLNNLVKTYNYSYDDVGNITSDSFKNYDYDEIYRLTGVSNSGGTLESLSYDKAGNRINNFNALIGSGANYDYTTNNLNQYVSLSGSVNRYVIEEIISEIEGGNSLRLSGTGGEENSGSGESESSSGETNTSTGETISGSTTGSGNTGSGEINSSTGETNSNSGVTETSNTESGTGSEETNSGSESEAGSGIAIGTLITNNNIVYGNGEEGSGSGEITYLGGLVNFDDSTSYVYDNNGNIINNGKYKFIYDYKNRIVEVTNQDNETIVNYEYDILDRRYKKESPSKLVEYTFSNENILEENITNSGSSTITKEYINGLGTDDLIAYDLDSVRYYFNLNHLGSIDGITDNSGTTLISYEYDSYGNTFVESSGSLIEIGSYTGITYENDRLYTGREFDREINLYYLRARYYDSKIGRFISRDPIDISDDVNLYGYVGNNPVIFLDLMGLEKNIIILSTSQFNKVGGFMEMNHIFYDNNPIEFFLKFPAYHYITTRGYAKSEDMTFNDMSLAKNYFLKKETEKRSNIKANESFQKYTDNVGNCSSDGDNGCYFYLTDDKTGKKYQTYLADIGNMALFYNGQKSGFSYDYIAAVAMAKTKAAAKENGQSEAVAIANEIEDAVFYKAGYELSKSTKTGEMTQEQFKYALLNAVKQTNGR